MDSSNINNRILHNNQNLRKKKVNCTDRMARKLKKRPNDPIFNSIEKLVENESQHKKTLVKIFEEDYIELKETNNIFYMDTLLKNMKREGDLINWKNDNYMLEQKAIVAELNEIRDNINKYVIHFKRFNPEIENKLQNNKFQVKLPIITEFNNAYFGIQCKLSEFYINSLKN